MAAAEYTEALFQNSYTLPLFLPEQIPKLPDPENRDVNGSSGIYLSHFPETAENNIL
jgi:hypothetical protein